jgi:hydroxyethylthiazole kinase
MQNATEVWQDVLKIRETNPLVHNITNYVVMNTTANALLSIGASPVMAHAEDEVEQMVAIANSLVINIGTLSSSWIHSMKQAVTAAGKRKIPWVLDPVGAGATPLRTKTALELIKTAQPTVIRGNASEIISLVQADGQTKGVDSSHSTDLAFESAKELSKSTGSIICISGGTDIIIGLKNKYQVKNGHPMMPRVTGLGCTASALIGAFLAVNSDYLQATAHAMAVIGIAGEIAASKANGPGTLQLFLLDALYQLGELDLERYLQLEVF